MSDLEEALGVELEDGEEDEIWRHWKGMPEFYNENLDKDGLYTSINVKIRTREDLEELSKRIGKNLTSRTKSMWYPYREPEQLKYYAWIDENDIDYYWNYIEEIIE